MFGRSFVTKRWHVIKGLPFLQSAEKMTLALSFKGLDAIDERGVVSSD